MEKLKILHAIITLSWLAVATTLAILLLMAFGQPATTHAHQPTDASTEATQLSEALTPQIKTGKRLFKANCGSCHHRNMVDDLTGPALKGVRERWSDFPKQDLYNWIKNPAKLIHQQHPRALYLWQKWNKEPMPAFANLSNDDVEAILTYINQR